jgi:rod shape-determining protein MreD
LYLVIPFLALIALTEATVLPQLRVANTQPDLMLLVIGAWSLRRGVEEGAVWAFIGGIFLDLLSAGPTAGYLFALLAASLVLGIDPSTGLARRQAQPVGGNPLVLIVGVILGTLIYHVVLLAALQLASYPVDWLDALTRVIAPHLLFNLALMPFAYRGLGWLERRTRREELAL